MKAIRLCFYLLAFCSFNSLFAQEESGNGLLFPQFEKGIVTYKTGVSASALFNYDMIGQQMLFLKSDSTVLTLAHPLDVLVVTIGERRFLPISAEGIFYEEIQAGKGFFYVKWKTIRLSEGKAVGYGGYSQIASTTTYTNLPSNISGSAATNTNTQGTGSATTNTYSHNIKGTSGTLHQDEKFGLKMENDYYLKSNNSYKKFFSAISLGKLFKGHEAEINEFAKEQSIDFSKINDVTRIVEYGYSIVK
jgi:hypothetical protein